MGRMMTFAFLMLVALTEAQAGDQHKQKAQHKQHDEYYYQQAVDSDKKNLESALSNMDDVASDYRRAAENETHAKLLSQRLAEITYDEAATDVSQNKAKAVADFNTALSTLKSSSSGGSQDNEKMARQKSNDLDKIERQEKDDAMKRLDDKGRHERDQVRKTYHATKEALRKLHKDRHSLVNAMRHAGRQEHGEHGFETADDYWEHYTERHEGYAEHRSETANHAVEHILEHAKDRLEDKERRVHEAASSRRQRQIEEIMSASRDTKNQLEEVRKQVQSLSKSAATGGNNKLVVVPTNATSLPLFTGVCLFAAGSLGFMIFFVRKSGAEPIREPLLQTW